MKEHIAGTRWAWVALVALGLLAGCGGGEDRSKAQLRLIHASPAYQALDLVVDDDRIAAGTVYGDAAAYAEVEPAPTTLQIRRAGATAALYSGTPSMSRGERYSIVAYGREGALRAQLLADNVSEPDTGKARLQVLNGAVEAGALDVYLTPDSTALIDSEPSYVALPTGNLSAQVDLDAATWRLRVTAAGDAGDLRLDLPGLVLSSRQVATLVITPGSGGVLVQALLLTQRGTIVPLASAHARVRAIAGVTGSGSVSASVGGVSLLGGVGAPAVGAYRLVPAGAATVQVSVNGAELTLPAADLAPGSDHSLLVWGDSGGATASWLSDDNRPSSVSGKVRLRLVHAVADLAGPLALTVGFSPLADTVQPGTASAYGAADVSTAASLSVTSPGFLLPLVKQEDQLLLADGVYSMFVVGAIAAPTGILFKDR